MIFTSLEVEKPKGIISLECILAMTLKTSPVSYHSILLKLKVTAAICYAACKKSKRSLSLLTPKLSVVSWHCFINKLAN